MLGRQWRLRTPVFKGLAVYMETGMSGLKLQREKG